MKDRTVTAEPKGRQKKCWGCGEYFRAHNSMHRACSLKCAQKVAQADKERQQRHEVRHARQRLKTRSQWQREAQTAFNTYIRWRDADKPCISCGAINPDYTRGGQWDCGHYRSTGANPELRFTELNAHKQCKRCNQHLSGNVVNFRIGLLQRIGQANLGWLEGNHDPRNDTIDDLKAIKHEYKAKTRELRRRNE